MQDTVWIWPECLPIFDGWQAIQTQWRTGCMGGLTGLDYAGVRAWLQECGPQNKVHRREWFECFQACEVATLAAWAAANGETESAA